MNLEKVVDLINTEIYKQQPKQVSSSWILKNIPQAYRYIQKNVRTKTNDIDWDTVISLLNRDFQKKWVRYRRKVVKPYENQEELNIILNGYEDRLYTFIAVTDEEDKVIRDKIIISLVRLSQKGNILAQQELVTQLTYITDDWIEKHFYLKKWKGYSDDVEDKIKGCIRCYRYTGSFLGYLYKTLEYSGRGIIPVQKFSLDDPVGDSGATKIDFVVVEE